eukprot:g17815.t1
MLYLQRLWRQKQIDGKVAELSDLKQLLFGMKCVFVALAFPEFSDVRIVAVDEGYLLVVLKLIDQANEYLLWRDNTGMKVSLIIFKSIRSLFRMAMILLLAVWVCEGVVYYMTGPETLWLIKDDDSEIASRVRSWHSSKYGSIASSMYEAFFSFNGEFPLGAAHQSNFARLSIVFGCVLGAVCMAFPVGLIGGALEEVMQETETETGELRADAFEHEIECLMHDDEVWHHVEVGDEDSEELRYGEYKNSYSTFVMRSYVNATLETAALLSIACFFFYDHTVNGHVLFHQNAIRHGGKNTARYYYPEPNYWFSQSRTPRSQSYYWAFRNQYCTENCGKNYLQEENGTLLNICLGVEAVATLLFLAHYVVRVLEDNAHMIPIMDLKRRYREAHGFDEEVDLDFGALAAGGGGDINSGKKEQEDAKEPWKPPFFMLTVDGIFRLLYWFPSLVFLLLFLKEDAGSKTGKNYAVQYMDLLYGAVVFRILVFERRVGVFRRIAFLISGSYFHLYEHFLTWSVVLMVLGASFWPLFEQQNYDDDMRHRWMGSPASALWVTLLTLIGEAPTSWDDFSPGGRTLHLLLYAWAAAIFVLPCALFASAYQSYMAQAYFADELSDDDEDFSLGSTTSDFSSDFTQSIDSVTGEPLFELGLGKIARQEELEDELYAKHEKMYRDKMLAKELLPPPVKSNPWGPDWYKFMWTSQYEGGRMYAKFIVVVMFLSIFITAMFSTHGFTAISLLPDLQDQLDVIQLGKTNARQDGRRAAGFGTLAASGRLPGMSSSSQVAPKKSSYNSATTKAPGGGRTKKPTFQENAPPAGTGGNAAQGSAAGEAATAFSASFLEEDPEAAEPHAPDATDVQDQEAKSVFVPDSDYELELGRPPHLYYENRKFITIAMGNEKSVYSNRADQAEMFFALVTDDIAERPLSMRKLKEGHGLGSSSGKKAGGKADRYPEEDADVEKGKWRFVGAYDAAVYNYRYGKVIPWSDAVGKQYLTIRLQGAFKKINRFIIGPFLNRVMIEKFSKNTDRFVQCAKENKQLRDNKESSAAAELLKHSGAWAKGDIFLPMMEMEANCYLSDWQVRQPCDTLGLISAKLPKVRDEDPDMAISAVRTAQELPAPAAGASTLEFGETETQEARNRPYTAAFAIDVDHAEWLDRFRVVDYLRTYIAQAAHEMKLLKRESKCSFTFEVESLVAQGSDDFRNRLSFNDVHILHIERILSPLASKAVEQNKKFWGTRDDPITKTHEDEIVPSGVAVRSNSNGGAAENETSDGEKSGNKNGPDTITHRHPENLRIWFAIRSLSNMFLVAKSPAYAKEVADALQKLAAVMSRAERLFLASEDYKAVAKLATRAQARVPFNKAGKSSEIELETFDKLVPGVLRGKVFQVYIPPDQEERTHTFTATREEAMASLASDYHENSWFSILEYYKIDFEDDEGATALRVFRQGFRFLDYIVISILAIDFIMACCSAANLWYARTVGGVGHFVFLVSAGFGAYYRVHTKCLYVVFDENDPRKTMERISCACLAGRMFVICMLDRFSPALRIVCRILWKYGTEFGTIFYGFVVLLLVFTYLIRLCEFDSAELAAEPRDEGESLKSRFATFLSSLHFMVIHSTGDYPLVHYGLLARVFHFFLILFATGFLGAPVGLVAAVIVHEMKQTKRILRQNDQDGAARTIQRGWRMFMAMRKVREMVESKKIFKLEELEAEEERMEAGKKGAYDQYAKGPGLMEKGKKALKGKMKGEWKGKDFKGKDGDGGGKDFKGKDFKGKKGKGKGDFFGEGDPDGKGKGPDWGSGKSGYRDPSSYAPGSGAATKGVNSQLQLDSLAAIPRPSSMALPPTPSTPPSLAPSSEQSSRLTTAQSSSRLTTTQSSSSRMTSSLPSVPESAVPDAPRSSIGRSSLVPASAPPDAPQSDLAPGRRSRLEHTVLAPQNNKRASKQQRKECHEERSQSKATAALALTREAEGRSNCVPPRWQMMTRSGPRPLQLRSTRPAQTSQAQNGKNAPRHNKAYR